MKRSKSSKNRTSEYKFLLFVHLQVTIRLHLIFKPFDHHVEVNDLDLAEKASIFGYQHEITDIRWCPVQHQGLSITSTIVFPLTPPA